MWDDQTKRHTSQQKKPRHTTYVQSEQRAKTNWFKFKCSKADTANRCYVRFEHVCVYIVFARSKRTHKIHIRRVRPRTRARMFFFFSFSSFIRSFIFSIEMFARSSLFWTSSFVCFYSLSLRPLTCVCFSFFSHMNTFDHLYNSSRVMLTTSFISRIMRREQKRNENCSGMLLSPRGGIDLDNFYLGGLQCMHDANATCIRIIESRTSHNLCTLHFIYMRNKFQFFGSFCVHLQLHHEKSVENFNHFLHPSFFRQNEKYGSESSYNDKLETQGW